MKYLRLFEELNIIGEEHLKIYWLIPTDERFEDSLNKINCSEHYRKIILSVRDKDTGYMFVGYDEGFKKSDFCLGWGWNWYEGEVKNAWYEQHDYIFGGIINIPECEFVSKKYNI